MEATMKLFTKTALVAPLLLLLSACNNEIDPIIGEYELVIFGNLSMPISETQTEVEGGIFCDVERNGIVAFSNSLGFSLTAQERLFNCTDISFNSDDSVIILGNGSSIASGSTYNVEVFVDDILVILDCNLQEDNLFCQGDTGNTEVEFQATRVQ
jgi:hypothetical protein